MSKSQPTFLDVLKAVLLPIDSDTLVDCYSYLRDLTRDTNWQKLFNRIEGVSVLILIIGSLFLSILYLLQGKAKFDWISTIGLQYILGFAFLVFYSLTRVTIRIVNNINTGESVFSHSSDTSPLIFVGKLTSTVLFLFVPVYAIWTLEVNVVESALMLTLAFLVFGSLIAGLSSAFSLLIQISSTLLG